MDKNFEKTYHIIEKSHFWFKARRHLIFKLIHHIKKSDTILDAGCAGGTLLLELKEKGFKNLKGIDISPEAVQVCTKRGLNVTQMDANELTFPDNHFDCIIASDLIAHLEEDHNLIDTFYKKLKPNGTLVLFTPALPSLWSNHDILNHHKRRYTKARLVDCFRNSSFKGKRVSYWNFFLLPIIFLVIKTSKKSHSKSNLDTKPGLLNPFFYILLRIENALLSIINIPIGVSLFIVAKKPA